MNCTGIAFGKKVAGAQHEYCIAALCITRTVRLSAKLIDLGVWAGVAAAAYYTAVSRGEWSAGRGVQTAARLWST